MALQASVTSLRAGVRQRRAVRSSCNSADDIADEFRSIAPELTSLIAGSRWLRASSAQYSLCRRHCALV
jgi:hypothetical protein